MCVEEGCCGWKRVGSGWNGFQRTVTPRGGFVVEVVSHDGGCLVEDAGELVLVLDVGDDFVEEVGVVAAAGLDEDLLDGGALCWVRCQFTPP